MNKKLHMIPGCILLAWMLCASGPGLQAAERRLDTLRVLRPSAEWRGDSLRLSFTCGLPGRLRGARSLHVVPLYVFGTDTVRFPELGCYSPSGARFRRRRVSLSGGSDTERVFVSRDGSPDSVAYGESLLVPSSPEGVFVLGHEERYCCSSRLLYSEEVSVPVRPCSGTALRPPVRSGTARPAASVTLPPPVAVADVPLFEANVTFVEPAAEPVKERTLTAVVRLTYPSDVWRVCPGFGDNAAELDSLDRLLSPVVTDTSSYRVLSASITGYASVEDTWGHNLELSERRARGVRDYLTGRYGLPPGLLSAEGRGEDWEGLRRAVASGGLPGKERVLSVIDTYGVFDGREKALMDLDGGRVYRLLLRDYFPALRRMETVIRYRVRSFSASEAGRLILRRPRDLSLREMYAAAREGNSDRTIRRCRDGYGREYDIAVRCFPGDDAANINASSAALVRGDLEEAWLFLSRVKDNPLAANNLGVYHWLCGRVAEAEAFFEKALSSDPSRAARNLEQLRRWKEEFDNRSGEGDALEGTAPGKEGNPR